MKLNLSLPLAGLITLPGCCTLEKPAAVPDLHDAKQHVSRYVSSGRYDAEVAAVVAEARAWLEHRTRKGDKLAMVLDIDETALSNLPVLKLNDWGVILQGATNAVKGPCGLFEWMELARAQPILPTLELVRRAREGSVAVFFVTARPERLRAATERNLRTAGYEWTDLVLKPARPPGAARGRSEAEDKTAARKRFAEAGYTIILNLGDQQSDLAGGFAERAFKLPNPFYFVP